jgi:hypothetical protein
MLIYKGPSINDIVTIKLTSGEEIIAKLVHDDNDSVRLSKPLVLTATNNSLGMVPYLFTVNPDKEIKMMKSTIVVMECTDTEYSKQYSSATSGLIL